MTEDIFTGILEAYRKEEISIRKAKKQIRLLLDEKETSEDYLNLRVIEELEAIYDLANPIECQGGDELFINLEDLEKIIRIKELIQD